MLGSFLESLGRATVSYWTLRQTNFELVDPQMLTYYFEAWLEQKFPQRQR